MYKILYLTQFPEIGGGETILLSLLKNLDRKKFEPIVIIPKRGQLSKKLDSLKIKTYYLSLNPYLIRTFFIPGASPAGFFQLAALVKKIKPDLIHLNHLTLAIYAGFIGKIFSASRRIPVIATAHGSWDSIYFYQDLVNQFFVDKILANTLKTAKLLLRRKIVNPKKVQIVPFGIDTDRFKPLPGQTSGSENLQVRRGPSLRVRNFSESATGPAAQNSFVVTIVGRLDPIKDHLTFLKAAEIVRKKIKNVTFLIVGDKTGDFTGQKNNYYEQIKNFLENNPNLNRATRLTGFINNMPAVYQASDIVVSTSISESFGLALAEAASCRVPTISTSPNPVVQNGKNGFIVKNDPGRLAEKIIHLAQNPKLRSRFGTFGREYVTVRFSLDNYVDKIQKEYLNLIA